jgi:hypothetical protein
VNALYFIAYTAACTFAVFMNGHVVHVIGYDKTFFILGSMSLISVYIMSKMTMTLETFMPFVETQKLSLSGLAHLVTPGEKVELATLG